MSVRVMVLAAGRGERMRPLTDRVPKPMLEVNGRPLIDHHLWALADAGVEDVVVNLGWCGDVLRRHLGDGRRYGLRLRYSEEGWPALETGGGIHRALPLLGAAPFIVVNGDVYSDLPMQRLVERARSMAMSDLAHLVLVPNPPHHPSGDFAMHGARVAATDGLAKLTFSGLSVLRPELFADAQAGAFPLAPLLRAAILQGRVSAERHDGCWSDVGTPERLAALNERLGDAGE
ncbi:MAG: nucleotidyltransferase family protein [Nevskiales bacterium]|nr:nucleotidyltransferase family protein [Nevskiales bacterium]